MIFVRPADVVHKTWLLRLLAEIADNSQLCASLIFKGGTAASMLGFLDRFSVDLDFDLKPKAASRLLLTEFRRIFATLNLSVHRQSSKTLSFVLKYPNPKAGRNSIKLNALPNTVRSNRYEPQYLAEIDRVFTCQTIETMVANKLVAPMERFRKYRVVAGRDFYDIHYFFMQGYRYEPSLITERTKLSLPDFFQKLLVFTQRRVNQTIINQDLSVLLPTDSFQRIRKALKTEVMVMLQNELAGLEKKL